MLMFDTENYIKFNRFYFGNKKNVDDVILYIDQLIKEGRNGTPFVLLVGEPNTGKAKFFKKICYELKQKKRKISHYCNDSIDMADGQKINKDLVNSLAKDFQTSESKIRKLIEKIPEIVLSFGVPVVKFLTSTSIGLNLNLSKIIKATESPELKPSVFGYNPVLWEILENISEDKLLLLHVAHLENAFEGWFAFLQEYIRHLQNKDRKVIIFSSLNQLNEVSLPGETSRLNSFLKNLDHAGLLHKIPFKPLRIEELKSEINQKFTLNKFPDHFYELIFTITKGKAEYISEIIKKLMQKDKIIEDTTTCVWYLKDNWKEAIEPYMGEYIVQRFDSILPKHPELDRNILMTFLSVGALIGITFPVQPIITLLKEQQSDLDEDVLIDIVDTALIDFSENILEDLGYEGHIFKSQKNPISAYRFTNHVIHSWFFSRLSPAEREQYATFLANYLEKNYHTMKDVLWPVARNLFELASNKRKSGYYQRLMDWNLPQETYDLLHKELIHHINEQDIRAKELHFNALLSLVEEKMRKWSAGTLLGVVTILEELWDNFENLKDYAKILAYKSDILLYLGHRKKSLDIARASLSVYKKINLRPQEARVLSSIGWIYHSSDEYDKAMECYKPALDIAREVGDRQAEAIILSNIGGIHKLECDYDKAMECYKPALDIAREVGNRQIEAAILYDIGRIHKYRHDYDKAMEWYKPALDIAREVGDRQTEAITLSEIGAIHRYSHDYDKAMECFESALDIARKIGYRQAEAGALSNIGVIHKLECDYNKAMKCYKPALDIAREVGDRQTEAGILYDIGAIHRYSHDYDKAMECFESALDIVREIGYRQIEAGILSNIEEIHKLKGKQDTL
ncbi:Photosystem I assembly protein Ycf3 [subsurface metagenome]